MNGDQATKKSRTLSTGCGCSILLFFLFILAGIRSASSPSNVRNGVAKSNSSNPASRQDRRPLEKSPSLAEKGMEKPADTKSAAPFQIKNKIIDEPVEYSVIDEEIISGITRRIDVRLTKKISEKTLEKIAYELKAKADKNYERTFIFYLLPGMESGAGAWATTHFHKGLRTQILGLTADQEKAMKVVPEDPLREVLGSWLYEEISTGCRYVLFRREGKLFVEVRYGDGSGNDIEVNEKKTRIGTWYLYTKRNFDDEKFLLDLQGNLQLWDKKGQVWTAKKFKL
jgi:hypothetical protein